MNLNFLKLGLLIIGLTTLISCSQSDKVEPGPGPSTKPYIQLSSVVYKTTGQNGERKFNVTANRAWKVELTDEQKTWISVTPESSADGKVQVTLSIAKNMEVGPRSTDVKFFIEEDPSINALFKISQGTEFMFNKDSLALVDFYKSTNGDQWTNKWDLSQPVAKWGYYYAASEDSKKAWEGVYIGTDSDNSRRVTSLWWTKDNNMSGVINDSFKDLTSLGGLALAGFKSDAGFNFSSLLLVLKDISALTQLWLLDGCTFNASRIGNDLGDLRNLFALNIDKHDFVGFEEDFGSFTLNELAGFTINNGEFTSTLESKYFAFMPRVAVISLSNNKFQGEVPDNFTVGKQRLMAIELNGNCLNGVFPSSIRNSPIFTDSEGLKMICPQNADCGGGFVSGCE